VDALVAEAVGAQYAFGAAEHIGHDRHIAIAEPQIADFDAGDPNDRHDRSASCAVQFHSARYSRHTDAVCQRGNDGSAIGAGVEHQAERPLAVDIDRRPDPPDAIA
jgi:hypothetical protein